MNSDRCRDRPRKRSSGSLNGSGGDNPGDLPHDGKGEDLLEELENFAEALAILHEWDESEQRETRDDEENADATGA